MTMFSFFYNLNLLLALPTCLVLLGVAIILSIRLRFIQFRSFKKFYTILRSDVEMPLSDTSQTISPIYALFTAMSTSLGIGTIIGPSVAIIVGGPGALFWLSVYSIFASITKYAEVAFAIKFRNVSKTGVVIGGPMHYLKTIASWLGSWYAVATVCLFTGWSGVQSNTLSAILAQEGLPVWITGAGLALLVYLMLLGGAQRVGAFSSKLVPVMTVVFIFSSSIIFYTHAHRVLPALYMIFKGAFSGHAAIGGFLGATMLSAIRAGVYRGAYITESGVGTAAIPHSLAHVNHATDQATLAMVSVFVDTAICFLSGLLVLCTDLWRLSQVSNIVVYQVFNYSLPLFGRPIIVLTVFLFALGTIVGNSFNGRQSFASLTNSRYISGYNVLVACIIFISANISAPLVWEIVDVLMPLVAIPNAVGILYLVTRHIKWLRREV